MYKNKKTVFNATFEESQNFVTKEYVENCFKKSDNDIIAKRTLGVFISSGILFLCAFCYSIVETKSPYGNQMFASYLNILWYGASILIPIYYIVELILYKNKRILHAYIFTKAMTIIYFLMMSLSYLFTINVASIIIGYKFLLIFYSLFYVYFVISRVLKIKRTVYNSLYHQIRHETKLLSYYEKFEKFAKKYSFLVILGLFIYRQFRGSSSNVKTDWIQQASIIIFPFVICFVLIFILTLWEAQLPGYYVNKYSEQYREKYGYSEFDWAEGNN